MAPKKSTQTKPIPNTNGSAVWTGQHASFQTLLGYSWVTDIRVTGLRECIVSNACYRPSALLENRGSMFKPKPKMLQEVSPLFEGGRLEPTHPASRRLRCKNHNENVQA
ncbi:hypothetical protein L596_025805 [Steinernema carpocapsae]|uniref:Uncharacterized protein n=1 Tax=Steinernema carpocapsae TaxID=34508 RepID=A0A4U5M8W0_STECR|nr:hypothetical protein L596_025805 [Steinernema carpocapsae]